MDLVIGEVCSFSEVCEIAEAIVSGEWDEPSLDLQMEARCCRFKAACPGRILSDRSPLMSNFFGFGFAPATPGNNRPYHFQVIPITTLVPGKLNKISYLCVDFCAPEVQNEGKLTKKGPGGFGSGVIAGGPGRACLDTVQPQRASRFHRAATSRFGPR